MGVSFFPKAEKGQFFVNIDLPAGSSFYETNRIAQKVERMINQNQNVSYVAANIGHGNPRLYYNVFTERHNATHAHIFVRLKEYQRKEMIAFINHLRKQFAMIAGAKIKLKELEQ